VREPAERLDAAAFAGRMAALDPFEDAPRLAVGVSGGADSLALALLADGWARARGGSIVALTVDHGLRPEAATEARRVAAWMAGRDIAHHVLTHHGRRPEGDVQAAARSIRHRLLLDACHALGCLHLLLAHHRDDQAETLLLRLARGSGVAGLAAMAPIVYRPQARVLRPLLDVPRAALKEVLRHCGQAWIEDPSNDDPAYARVRLRAARAVLAAEGLDSARLAATANRLGRARRALAAGGEEVLARHVVIDPRGWAEVDMAGVLRAPEEVALRLLADVLTTVGGREHPPRAERLERLAAAWREGATLHGCRLVPRGGGGERVLVVREARGLPVVDGLRGGATVLWDGRFRLCLTAAAAGGSLGPLGEEGWRAIAEAVPDAARRGVPAAARPSLPALRDGSGLLAVPHFGYLRASATAGPVASLRFAPARAAGTLGFRLEPDYSGIM
jgi:tRNA(Ile)-lysidine synthase